VERKRFLNASGPSGSQTPLLTYHPDILFSINFYVITSRVASSAFPNFFLVSMSIKSSRLPSSVDSFHLFAPYSQPLFALSTSGVYNSAVHFIAVDLLGTRFTIRANFKRWVDAVCSYDLSCRKVLNSCKFGSKHLLSEIRYCVSK